MRANFLFMNRQNKANISITIVGILGAIICCAIIAIIFSKIIRLNAELDETIKHFSMYAQGRRNYPTEERKEFLQKQRNELQNIIDDLSKYELAWKKNIEPFVHIDSPLKFKELLFQTKKTLRQKASQKNILLSDDIGFYEWERKLPPQEKIDELGQALTIVEKLINDAIDISVDKVASVSFEPLKKVYVSELEDSFFYERAFYITITGKYDVIYNYLARTQTGEKVLFVDSCRLYNAVTQNTSHLKERSREEIGKELTLEGNPTLTAEIVFVNEILVQETN